MIISEDFSLEGPRRRVFDLLLDIHGISSCMPGVTDVTKLAEGHYRATLTARVGPIEPRFKAALK